MLNRQEFASGLGEKTQDTIFEILFYITQFYIWMYLVAKIFSVFVIFALSPYALSPFSI